MPFSIGKSAHTLTYNEKTDLNSIIKKINRGPYNKKVKTAEDAAQITRQLIDAALTPNDLSLATLLKNTSIQVNKDEAKSIVELLNSPNLADYKSSLQERLGTFITYAATKEAHAKCETLLAIFKRTDIPKRRDELTSDRESTYYPEMQKTLDLSVINDLEKIPFNTLQTLFPKLYQRYYQRIQTSCLHAVAL